jgi:hypothetical protein
MRGAVQKVGQPFLISHLMPIFMGFDYKNDAFIRHFLPLWAVQKEKFGLFRQPLLVLFMLE